MMTKDGKTGYRLPVLLFVGMLAAGTGALFLSGTVRIAAEPAPLTPEEQREKLVIERFVGVLEKNPRRGTALDRIYGYHVERGSLDKFLETYATRTKKDVKDGVAWMIVGLLESQRGRDANAVAAFRQAETQQPDNPIASYYLGQSLVLVGQPDAAAEAFERALTRQPNRTDLLDIFQALGRVYQRAQRTEKALGVWNRLEKLFPDDQRVQEQIASTLAEEGQFEQALARYEKLAKAAKDPYKQAAFRMEAAELKVRLKQTSKALADFADLLGQLNPESWLYREVRRKVEEVFLRNDDQAGLAKYYESWLAKNASDVEAMTRSARSRPKDACPNRAPGWRRPCKRRRRGATSGRRSSISWFSSRSTPKRPGSSRRWTRTSRIIPTRSASGANCCSATPRSRRRNGSKQRCVSGGDCWIGSRKIP